MTDRAHILALDHIASIEDPIRVTGEDGRPYLHYSAQHVKAAFIAALTRRAGGDAIPAVERLALRAIKAVTATGKDGPRALSRIMAIASSAGVEQQYTELLADPDVALIVERPRTEWAHLFKPGATGCAIPPDGWECSRERGHDGPCAATPKPPAGGDAGAVAELIQWARDQMALPDGSGWLGGHIDENHRYKLRDLVGAIDAARQDAAALALPAPVGEHADWMHVARESVAAALPGSVFAKRVMAGHHDDSLEVRAAMRAIDATLAALSEGRSHG